VPQLFVFATKTITKTAKNTNNNRTKSEPESQINNNRIRGKINGKIRSRGRGRGRETPGLLSPDAEPKPKPKPKPEPELEPEPFQIEWNERGETQAERATWTEQSWAAGFSVAVAVSIVSVVANASPAMSPSPEDVALWTNTNRILSARLQSWPLLSSLPLIGREALESPRVQAH
jgi:hypothetical protein